MCTPCGMYTGHDALQGPGGCIIHNMKRVEMLGEGTPLGSVLPRRAVGRCVRGRAVLVRSVVFPFVPYVMFRL